MASNPVAALTDVFKAPAASALSGLLGFLKFNEMGRQAPQPPNLGETVPRGPMGQGTGPGRTYQPFQLDPRTAGALGINRGQPGNPSPQDIALASYGDTERGFAAANEQRGRDIRAAEGVSQRVGGGLQQMRSQTDAVEKPAIRAGNRAFSGARNELEQAEGAAATSTAAAVASTTELVMGFQEQFQASLSEMRNMKDEMLAGATDRTASLLSQTVHATQLQTQARLEDARAEMTAMGIQPAQALAIGEQIRMEGARQIGDTVNQMVTERAYQLDQLRLSADTNIGNFMSTFTQAFGGVTQQASAEIAGSFRRYGDQRVAIAEGHRMLAQAEADWRNSTVSTRSTIEANIMEASLRGAEMEANMWKSVMSPFVEVAPIMDVLFEMQRGLESTQFAYDQASYSNDLSSATVAMNYLFRGVEGATNAEVAYRNSHQSGGFFSGGDVTSLLGTGVKAGVGAFGGSSAAIPSGGMPMGLPG